MRQGHHHQNRRNRGRSRKGPSNPLTRSFESNGPDVKIRGTPAHIAEKYMSLARDALASDDPVLAENYLQHAEHYNRIIMAYREQQFQQGGGEVVTAGMGGGRFGSPMGPDEEFGDDGDDYAPDMGGGQQPMTRGFEHQPSMSGDRPERGEQREGRDRDRDRDRGDRPDRSHRYEERQRRHEHRQHRDREPRAQMSDRQPDVAFPVQGDVQPVVNGANGSHAETAPRPERTERAERPERADRGDRPERAERGEGPARRRRDRFGANGDQQPDFLKRPVRRPRSEPQGEGEAAPAALAEGGPSEDGSHD